jgi:hypothetical protein
LPPQRDLAAVEPFERPAIQISEPSSISFLRFPRSAPLSGPMGDVLGLSSRCRRRLDVGDHALSPCTSGIARQDTAIARPLCGSTCGHLPPKLSTASSKKGESDDDPSARDDCPNARPLRTDKTRKWASASPTPNLSTCRSRC